jgi:hypothetical protein
LKFLAFLATSAPYHRQFFFQLPFPQISLGLFQVIYNQQVKQQKVAYADQTAIRWHCLLPIFVKPNCQILTVAQDGLEKRTLALSLLIGLNRVAR